MAKILQKEKARSMRIKGESVRDIAKELGISKGSVSYWCRDILLSKSQIKKLYVKGRTAAIQALLLGAERKRKERIDTTSELNRQGALDVGEINKRDLFMLGVGLYWAEGYKSGNEEIGFTNSDPAMIKLFISWLQKFYQIEKSRLILRISINKIHKNRIKEAEDFWVRYMGVQRTQFTKTSFIKAKIKKQYENNANYFGVLRVKVRNGTNLRRRIIGSINKLKSL